MLPSTPSSRATDHGLAQDPPVLLPEALGPEKLIWANPEISQTIKHLASHSELCGTLRIGLLSVSPFSQLY